MKTKAFFNWSGGKDSALALYKVLDDHKYSVEYLVTTISRQYRRISMHGVREALLDQQAENIGIPLEKVWLPEVASMEVYDEVVSGKMKELKEKHIEHAIFGDIFLEDLKKYREDNLARVGMQGIFPIWKRDSAELARAIITRGFQAITTCVDSQALGQQFVGRQFDAAFLSELPATVDPCGENGEFHSFVFAAPNFKNKIGCVTGETVLRDNRFYYCDLLPA